MAMVECLTCGGKLPAGKMKFRYKWPYVQDRIEYHCCGHCRDGNPRRAHGRWCELRNRGSAYNRSRKIYERSPSLDDELEIPPKRRREP